ncbi:hypothetical protein [Streptomyces chromofuscus]|nr:hypothetical protein [Streptomyces chromofuscus]
MEIVDEWVQDSDPPLLQQHIDAARRPAGVLRLCIEKRVPLLFL